MAAPSHPLVESLPLRPVTHTTMSDVATACLHNALTEFRTPLSRTLLWPRHVQTVLSGAHIATSKLHSQIAQAMNRDPLAEAATGDDVGGWWRTVTLEAAAKTVTIEWR